MTWATVTDQLPTDPEPFHRAAAAWAALAAGLDRADETYHRGLHRADVGWASGAGAEAAAQKLDGYGRDLRDAMHAARTIASALTRHAYGIGDLRRHAEAVADTGTDADLAELAWRAYRLDEETAAVLRANRPAASRYTTTAGSVAEQRDRTPAQVFAWWSSLSPDQREQAIRDDPAVIGGLDGVPAPDRDRANRSTLDSQLADLESREAGLVRQLERATRTALAAAPLLAVVPAVAPIAIAAAMHIDAVQRELADVRKTEAGLRTVADQLGRHGDRAFLLGIDGAGDGRTIVALGNPDTARHTAVFVPGVNTDLRDLGGDLNRVNSLHREAVPLAPAGEDVAVVYWLGYDTPGTLDALSNVAAHDGARALTPFVDGLRATHRGAEVAHHVTAIGHSYGSTVIAESALTGALRVDDIVAVGSPGMHTDRAASLHVDPRHVWGGLADGDLIGGGLGDLRYVHGEEPTDPAFGANRFTVDTRGHSAYWAENSASLRNQAYIVVARYDRVGYDFGGPPAS